MARAEKRGNGEFPWSVKYRTGTDPETGKPVYKRDSGFATETAAINHGKDQEADIRRGVWHDERKGQLTLDQYWHKWVEGYDTSDRNLRVREAQYKNHLKPRWGATPIGEIDALDVAAFEKAKRSQVSRGYANGIMELLRMMMDDAVFAGLLRVTPVRASSRRGSKEPPKKRQAIITDIPTLMQVCARLPAPDGLMFLMVLFTGMRWGEAIGVRRSFLDLYPAVGDQPAWGFYTIDQDIGAVHETRGGQRFFAWPKEHKGRVIELPPFLVEKLLAYLKTFPEERDLLFVDSAGQPFNRSNYNDRRWRPACDGWDGWDAAQGRRALLPAPAVAQGLVPHDLRHTHKTWLAEDGCEPVARDERLGHATPGMDGVYIHVTPAMRRKILRSLQTRWEKYQASIG